MMIKIHLDGGFLHHSATMHSKQYKKLKQYTFNIILFQNRLFIWLTFFKHRKGL